MTFEINMSEDMVNAVEKRVKKNNEESFELETERVITKEGLDYSLIIKVKNNSKNVKSAQKYPEGCGNTTKNDKDFTETLYVTCGINDYICPECNSVAESETEDKDD